MEEIKQEVEALNTATETIETQEVVKQPTKAELLKELSKDLGFDAFNPKEVRKQFDALKEFQESQKTEQEKLQEKLAIYEAKENSFKTKEDDYEARIAGLELGISSDKLADALALAKNNITDGQSIKEGLALVKEKYADMFVTKGSGQKIEIGTQTNSNNTAQQQEQDEALARYLARKKR